MPQHLLVRTTTLKLERSVVAMKQSNRWEREVATLAAPLPVHAVFGCPLFSL